MWQPDSAKLAEEISKDVGLHLQGSSGRDGQGHLWIDLLPQGVHVHDGFRVRIQLGWRSLRATFLPGTYADHLIAEMGRAARENRVLFSEMAKRSSSEGGIVNLRINGASAEPSQIENWPQSWQRFELSLDKSPVAVNTEDDVENDRQLEHWSRRFLKMVLALAPIEIDEQIEANPDGLPEGALVRVEVNRYERSSVNRSNCIEIRGSRCLACDFDFGQRYGRVGEGFIHVHHVVPVSDLGAGYVVNPASDLVPLCPNCHAMAHRAAPPLSVDELKQLLAGRELPNCRGLKS